MTSTVQTANSKLLWMIIGGISIIVLILFSVQWLLSNQPIIAERVVTQVETTSTSSVHKETYSSTNIDTVPNEDQTAPILLIEESILQTAVPQNESLAKEEIAKLDDIQLQLQDQKQELQAQHNDADSLIKLKEEQIKLLEAQLLQAQSS
ncbi:hypothetical protein F2A31_02125 [Acinetobacter suaedae]|uniref:Uncharacterized protein n=1 Tax=Acinetobacter suaedae TaxID=2609668 RepID=A0A5P1UTS3_9GAMM|nr:hypothetical protein [Acinetobacter sp. C16S1]QER38566.1 hypothetical protein F2A31_02125 [Acinetobacter sp. C16S1]